MGLNYLKNLEKKVFVFDSSPGDKEYFKVRMQSFVLGNVAGMFEDMLWAALHLRNGDGQTTKYLYYNERTGKLHIDRDFMEWAKFMEKQMKEFFNK